MQSGAFSAVDVKIAQKPGVRFVQVVRDLYIKKYNAYMKNRHFTNEENFVKIISKLRSDRQLLELKLTEDVYRNAEQSNR